MVKSMSYGQVSEPGGDFPLLRIPAASTRFHGLNGLNLFPKEHFPPMDSYKIHLSEAEMPQEWYNIIPDLPSPPPPYLHPATGQPITPADLAAIFPRALIEQEVSPERWIPIPDEVRRIYQLWRPSPLHRAYNLEKALKTPARIYYKNESVSPAGQPQAQHRGGPGLLQQGGGHQTAGHRDRGGPVGLRPVPGLQLFRHGMHRLHGQGELPPEALPPVAHAHLGGQRLPLPHGPHPGRPHHSGRGPRDLRQLWAWPSPRRWRTPPPTRTPTMPWEASSTTSCCTRPSSGSRPRSSWPWPGSRPDVLIGCVGGGSNFAGFCFPFVPDKLKGQGPPLRGGGAHCLPHPDQGGLHL